MPDTTAARPLPAFALLNDPIHRRQALVLARKSIRGGWLSDADRSRLRLALVALQTRGGLKPREGTKVAETLALLDATAPTMA